MSSDGRLLVCDIAAIPADQRPRYDDLIARLRLALCQLSELSDGYTYELDMERVTLLEIAEWITMERLCCPLDWPPKLRQRVKTQNPLKGE